MCSLPSAALGKGFAECNLARHSAKNLNPVVMAIARAICAWWNEAQDHRGRGGDWLEVVRREVDARSVKAMSTGLLQLINTLIQEKAKPNSTSEGDTDLGSSE